jgi:N-acetylglutamate synthase-like GNAT family acetyltransferase
VIDLILHIQQEEYNIPITKDDQPDLLNVKNFYQKGNGNFWLALYDEKVIGTVALLDIGNQQVALRKMFVDENYRGRKFKTSYLLLNHATEWAKKKGVQEVYLGTTLQFTRAQKFYERNDFQCVEPENLPEKFPIMEVDKKFYKKSLCYPAGA